MTQRLDGGLTNLLTGLGTGADPRRAARVCPERELGKGEIDALCASYWEAQKFVDTLPEEALRKWVTLTVEGGPDDAAGMILDDLEEKQARQHLQRALVYERQYGGSVLLLGVSDAADAKTPLDPEKIAEGDFRFVEPYSRYRMIDPGAAADLVADPNDVRFGLPEHYQILLNGQLGTFADIHWTRVIVFQGWHPREPDYRWQWGQSVLDLFWPSLRDYETAVGHGVALGSRLIETRLKIKGLTELLTGNPKGRDQARQMLQEIASGRSTFRIMMIDAEDSVEDASIPFTGYADLIKMTQGNLAAASGLSAQRFFGLPQQGLSNNDDSGSERDDAVVAAYQRDALLPAINRLVEISAASLGLKIKSFQVKFEPLREMTPVQLATAQQAEAVAAKTYVDMGAVAKEEVRETLRADPESPYQLQPGTVEEAFPPPAPVLPAVPQAAVPNAPQIGVKPQGNAPNESIPAVPNIQKGDEETEDADTPTGTKYFRWQHNYIGPHPRPTHVKRDGKVFRWDRLPLPYAEEPGEWAGCQCTSDPVGILAGAHEYSLQLAGLPVHRRKDGTAVDPEDIWIEMHEDGDPSAEFVPIWSAIDPVHAAMFGEFLMSEEYPQTEEQLYEELVAVALRALYREPEWEEYRAAHPSADVEEYVLEHVFPVAWQVWDHLREQSTGDAFNPDQPRGPGGKWASAGGKGSGQKVSTARSMASARAALAVHTEAKKARLEAAKAKVRAISDKRRAAREAKTKAKSEGPNVVKAVKPEKPAKEPKARKTPEEYKAIREEKIRAASEKAMQRSGAVNKAFREQKEAAEREIRSKSQAEQAKIPKDVQDRTYAQPDGEHGLEQAVNPQTASEGAFQSMKAAREGLRSIPEPVQKYIAGAKIHPVIADNVVDKVPDLRGRISADGRPYDTVGGVFSPQNKVAVTSTTYAIDSNYAMRHEMAHAVDNAAAGSRGIFGVYGISEKPGFEKLHQEAVQNGSLKAFNKATGGPHDYFAGNDWRGRAETFADITAHLWGGGHARDLAFAHVPDLAHHIVRELDSITSSR